MTTYGTIPPPPSPAVNLDYISRAKERLTAGLGDRRQWRKMFDLNCFDLPKSSSDAVARVRINAAYFLWIYAIIVLLIIFLGLLYHPISLIVFVAMMAAWLYLYLLRDEPLVVLGSAISDRTVLISLAVATVAVLMLTHAAANIVAALVVGIVVVLIHGAMRKTDDLVVDEAAAAGGLLWFSGGPSSSS